jgi:hypothetical protein
MDQTKKQIAEYRKFKKLIADWMDLAMEHCRLKLQRKNKTPSQS